MSFQSNTKFSKTFVISVHKYSHKQVIHTERQLSTYIDRRRKLDLNSHIYTQNIYIQLCTVTHSYFYKSVFFNKIKVI